MTFVKGQSGNPAGRKPGTTDRRTIFNRVVMPHADQLLEKAVEMAANGDTTMMKVLLDRFIPAVPKDDPVFNLNISTGTLSEQAERITKLINEARISPNEGKVLISGIAEKASIVKTAEWDRRVKILEQEEESDGQRKLP